MKFRLLVTLGELILRQRLSEDRPRGKIPILPAVFPHFPLVKKGFLPYTKVIL